MGSRIKNADVERIPLDVDELSNPAWWNAVIGGFHFDAAIQMHGPFAVLVVTERLQRQWKQERFFLGEHRRHLSLRRAVNARVRPARFPLIQVRLSLFQAFEAHSFQWCFLRVGDTRFHFPFAIGVANAARHRDDAVVRQYITEQRIDRWIVDVWSENALFQVIENQDATRATYSTKGCFMQLGPCAAVRTEYQ